jgi:hypothetical protein
MPDPTKLFVDVPGALRMPLLESYREIGTNFAEHRWEPSELDGGKFCEVVYAIISGFLSGSYPSAPSKPRNMLAACQALESAPSDPARLGDHSVRILIPRALPYLYDIRNTRGVGHIGGDVNPNFMDATVVYGTASWILAELIRIFHGTSIEEAQATVDALVERRISLVWKIEGIGIKRVLEPSMNAADQTLVLLYSEVLWVTDKDLLMWTEYSNLTMFRKSVLQALHNERLIEYDTQKRQARISPLGSREVEVRILKTRDT